MDQSRRERILTMIVAATLALLPAWFLATQLDPLLVPTDRDIADERARQQAISARQRASGGTLDPATRPLLDGVSPDGSAAVPSPKVRDFPAADTVDYESVGHGHGTTQIMIRDATGNGLDKVVRLRAAATGMTVATLYLPAGRTANAELPSLPYRITIAEGALWYGRAVHFGGRGRYYAPQTADVTGQMTVSITLPPAEQDSMVPLVDRDAF